MRKIAFFYLVMGMAVSLVLSVLVLSLGPNPISLNHRLPFKKGLEKLVPQGWAFFTKDVQNSQLRIFKYSENFMAKPLRLSSSSKDQYFGLKRLNRGTMHKLNYIMSQVKGSAWFKYQGNVASIPRDSLSKVSITADAPMLFGEYIIARGEPIPYEWENSTIKFEPELDYIIVNIKEK